MTESLNVNDSDPMPTIEGYHLIDEIGRGGMGIVYEAFQRSTGRRVAVKFMRAPFELGIGDAHARHRFEREVELIARLQHPNIASVLDSGIHQGRSYCVLEFIDGLPLDAYMKFGECTVSQSLTLMATICEAIDYAHQRGVLHRDLKPSNILVDAQGEPHVLDFGLAKHIDPASKWGIDVTLSSPGQIVGTLGYMSPEQSRGQHGEMSVRSDVYSLGAIMYQMLTGRVPCPITGPLSDVLRGIAEREPVRASSIRSDLDRDIDAILGKCLDKGSHRRYATAGELAADCRRYLKNEPIHARPQTRLLQISKWIQRNKAVSAIAALSAVAIVAIAVLSFQRIIHERDSSQAAAQWGKDVIASMNPLDGTKPQTMFATMVATARRTLETQLQDHPAEQASARITLGHFLLMLERYSEALAQFDQALDTRRSIFGPRSSEVAEATINRARALTWIARQSGDEHRSEKFNQALAVYQEAQAIRAETSGTRSDIYAECLHEIGSVYRDLDELDRAEELLLKALQLRLELHGEHSWLSAATRNNLALVYVRRKNFQQAHDLFQAALTTLETLPEAERRPLFEARTHQHLGECHFHLRAFSEAERDFRTSLQMNLVLFEEHSTTIARTRLWLAEALIAQSKSHDSPQLTEATQLLEQTRSEAGTADAKRVSDLKEKITGMRPATAKSSAAGHS